MSKNMNNIKNTTTTKNNNNNNSNQTTVEETEKLVIRNKHSRQYWAFWIGTGLLPLLSTIYMEILDHLLE